MAASLTITPGEGVWRGASSNSKLLALRAREARPPRQRRRAPLSHVVIMKLVETARGVIPCVSRHDQAWQKCAKMIALIGID